MVEDLKEALAEEEGSLQGEWPGSVAGRQAARRSASGRWWTRFGIW
jgi:hypothetical protein